MCGETVKTILKIAGLFFLLYGVLFVFLFLSFFHSYEMNMRILSSGFVSLFFSTLIWVAILLVLHREERPEEYEQENETMQEKYEQEYVQELIPV